MFHIVKINTVTVFTYPSIRAVEQIKGLDRTALLQLVAKIKEDAP